MWLLKFVPLPALKNENKPAISRVDLWCETVYGPAKTELASPSMKSQLAKKRQFSAENCLARCAPWPTKHFSIIAASVTFEPADVMKSRAITAGPM